MIKYLLILLVLMSACTTFTEKNSEVIARNWVQDQSLCKDIILSETQSTCASCWTFTYQCKPVENDPLLKDYLMVVPVQRGVIQDAQIVMANKIIDSFESCKAAGFDIIAEYPQKCITPEGKEFTEELSCKNGCGNGVCDTTEDFCRENALSCPSDCKQEKAKGVCGDGVCDAVVCLTKDCPDQETAKTCPQDCSTKSICEDLCGDGTCQKVVCMGQGCPCAESVDLCPSDC